MTINTVATRTVADAWDHFAEGQYTFHHRFEPVEDAVIHWGLDAFIPELERRLNLEVTPTRNNAAPVAVCYITRVQDGVPQLLVLHGHPDGGVQVVAGGVDDFETPDQAAIREAWEEAGLRLENPVFLGRAEYHFKGLHPDTREPLEAHEDRYFYHFSTDEPRDSWDHVVSAGEDDGGKVFHHKFVKLEGVRLDWQLDFIFKKVSSMLDGQIPQSWKPKVRHSVHIFWESKGAEFRSSSTKLTELLGLRSSAGLDSMWNYHYYTDHINSFEKLKDVFERLKSIIYRDNLSPHQESYKDLHNPSFLLTNSHRESILSDVEKLLEKPNFNESALVTIEVSKNFRLSVLFNSNESIWRVFDKKFSSFDNPIKSIVGKYCEASVANEENPDEVEYLGHGFLILQNNLISVGNWKYEIEDDRIVFGEPYESAFFQNLEKTQMFRIYQIET